MLQGNSFNGPVYTWLTSGGARFEIGFLIDPLTALMMVVVTFVSLMVHVYTIGYMAEDPGYQRFFSYISLFTFSMLMLVMANNFLQLFFGWEAVGLVSYLLIGFWYTRESAVYANLKAFLVNRVGDFGFILGIALILANFGTLDYQDVFQNAANLESGTTLICILLFIGAMGKSAQFPLHVWLPDSMEGPTPISALIHAATMVTAGIFMVARMSPLYELSETARSVVLIIGAITAFSMALIALTQYDIKRVVAYSTLSQLGYMTAALGASAYSAAIFHLMTHAFFKAVLFLAAGSVIIALHHEQDMRRMGGLKKYMPITYWTMLIGAISSAGIPGFAGFFSKDAIIEAVHHSATPGAMFAYALRAAHGVRHRCLHLPHGVHGVPRPPSASTSTTRRTSRRRWSPCRWSCSPSLRSSSGYVIGEVVFGDYFGNSLPPPDPNYYGLWSFIAARLHLGCRSGSRVAGIATAWFLYLRRPDLPGRIARALRPALRPGRAQVRLRRALRRALRRRRAQPRQGLLARRRPDADRRPGGERLGARGRLVLGRGAPVPERPTSINTRSAC